VILLCITKKIQLHIAVQLMNTDTKRRIWLNLPVTKDDFAEAVSKIGAERGNLKITGYNRRIPGLAMSVIMESPLSVVNHFASRINKLSDSNILKLGGIGDGLYYFEYMWQFVHFTYKPDDYTLLPGICDAEALGNYYLDGKTSAVQDSKSDLFIDRYEYGKNLAEFDKGYFTSHGYIMSKDKWSLKRKTHPVPESLDIRGYLGEDLYGDWDSCEW